MAFNAKTFDLASRPAYVQAWKDVAELLDEHEEPQFSPVGKRNKAFTYLHKLNRTRAAMRAQWTDGKMFDHIEVRVGEKEIDGKRVWGLRFTDRGLDTPDFTFILDAPE